MALSLTFFFWWESEDRAREKERERERDGKMREKFLMNETGNEVLSVRVGENFYSIYFESDF